jgi:hypothetical protein
MKTFLSLLLILSFVFSQEPCEGQCYTDEEAQNIEVYINELEQKDSINVKIIENLNSQIYMYIQKNENDSLWLDLQQQKINLLDNRILLYDDLIKEVEPKWYENKWLWFFGGIIVTSQSIKLASGLVD